VDCRDVWITADCGFRSLGAENFCKYEIETNTFTFFSEMNTENPEKSET
jgi:hypothetical protein